MKKRGKIDKAVWTMDKIDFFMEKMEEEVEDIKTELSKNADGTPNFEEGEEYLMDELPPSDMTASGKLEAVGNGRLAAQYGDTYVTFEHHSLKCVDVRDTDEVKENVRND